MGFGWFVFLQGCRYYEILQSQKLIWEISSSPFHCCKVMAQLPSIAVQCAFQNGWNDGVNGQEECHGKQQLAELIAHLRTQGMCAGALKHPYFVLWQGKL